jgi:hypothetical protein
MRREPATAAAEEFLDFIFANPVVFLVVEDGKQDVEVLQDILEPFVCGQCDAPIAAVAPLRKFLIERLTYCRDSIAEWFEEAAKKRFTTAARQSGDANLERKSGVGECLARFAPAAKGRAESPGESHAGERGRDVRAVVDVLIEKAAIARWPARLANKLDGIHFQQKRGGATTLGGFRIENVSLTERERDGVEFAGPLVQKEAKVRGGSVRGGDGEIHKRRLYGSWRSGARLREVKWGQLGFCLCVR